MPDKLIEGLRVRTTRPVQLWGAHWTYLWEKYGPGVYKHDVESARQEGYYFEPGSNEPMIPKGATGTIHKYARYITEHERPVPSFVTRIEDDERRQRVYEGWFNYTGKYPIIKEHIVLLSEDPPTGGLLSWTMFGIDFDDWPIGKNGLAGLGPSKLPDYLEVLT